MSNYSIFFLFNAAMISVRALSSYLAGTKKHLVDMILITIYSEFIYEFIEKTYLPTFSGLIMRNKFIIYTLCFESVNYLKFYRSQKKQYSRFRIIEATTDLILWISLNVLGHAYHLPYAITATAITTYRVLITELEDEDFSSVILMNLGTMMFTGRILALVIQSVTTVLVSLLIRNLEYETSMDSTNPFHTVHSEGGYNPLLVLLSLSLGRGMLLSLFYGYNFGIVFTLLNLPGFRAYHFLISLVWFGFFYGYNHVLSEIQKEEREYGKFLNILLMQVSVANYVLKQGLAIR